MTPLRFNAAAPPPGQALCRLDELDDPGSRGFRWYAGDEAFAGFVVRKGGKVFGYVDWCPHAGWPLAAGAAGRLTRDGRAIICNVHGALFRPDSGRCIAGPGQDDALKPWPVTVDADGVVRTG